jgi:glycosyltransferase involved in cell wall biosynthesis
MKLLIVTQKVDKNDPILGFFHRWLDEFSKNVEKLTVICLEQGEYHLPSNVQVLSLGKEKGKSRLKYLYRFYSYIWRERHVYDSVFVHMNPIYVILGGFYWKLMGKEVGLWYTHKNVDLKLRIAEKLCDLVFSASKESFRLKSAKLRVMGHGIDTKVFFPAEAAKHASGGRKKVVTSGRVSATKKIHIMLEAVALLEDKNVELIIVGSPSTPIEREYQAVLKAQAEQLGLADRVVFVGSKSQLEVAEILRDADLFINLSNTGSLDKAVLEAMASGVYVLTSNEAFESSADTFLSHDDPQHIAPVMSIILRENRRGQKRTYIESEHNIQSLIARLVQAYE